MDKNLNTSRLHKRICTFFLFSILLTPMIKIPGFIGVKLEDLLVFSIIFYYFFIQKFGFNLPLRALILLAFAPLLLLSITSGSLFLMPTSLADLTKYIWLVKAIVIYIVFFNYIYAEQSELNFVYILKIFILFSVLATFICIQQYFNLFNLNKWYIPLVAPSQVTTLMAGYTSPRVVGMLGNPNSQGYAFAIALICSIYLYLKQGNKRVLVAAFIILLGLFMTLSRGALICFIIGTVFLVFSYRKNWQFFLYKVFFFLVFLAIFILLYLWLKNNELIYNMIIFRFEALSNITQDKSFITRFHGWLINYQYFKINPVFGIGPLPRATDLFGMADNEWLFFLRAYGVVGIIWLLLFILLPLFLSKNTGLVAKNKKNFILACAIATMVYMIPAAVVTSSTLFPIFLVMLSMYDINKKVVIFGNK